MNNRITVDLDGEEYQIPESDLWRKPGADKPIISHDGVRRLMTRAGVIIEEVKLIITPTTTNNMRTAFVAVGTNMQGRRSFAVGEADATNLSPGIATKYPTVMAMKRAVDRLALDLLDAYGLYSEVEFGDLPSSSSAEKHGDEEGASVPSGGNGRTPSSNAGSSHASADNGSTEDPPTEKQIGYIRRLAHDQNLGEFETDRILRTVKTKSQAGKLISRMKLQQAA